MIEVFLMRVIFIACFVFLIPPAANAREISGAVRVVDGDTLLIGETRIRLEGIDAPETDQVCLDASGQRWTCGILARDRLSQHINSRQVTCTDNGHDRYGRVLGVCKTEGEDLNAWMVREGLALAYVKYSNAYIPEESAARVAQRGMWSGSFVAPWDYRHRNKATVILGAVAVPVVAQAKLLAPASSIGAPSNECVIKGNVNRKHELIYHLPGQLNYAQTRMDKGFGERWFCTEAEAQAAGWRKAGR
jgi:endonuclease YncB( thermonuclease family)